LRKERVERNRSLAATFDVASSSVAVQRIVESSETATRFVAPLFVHD
jgi:hypothetical protein